MSHATISACKTCVDYTLITSAVICLAALLLGFFDLRDPYVIFSLIGLVAFVVLYRMETRSIVAIQSSRKR